MPTAFKSTSFRLPSWLHREIRRESIDTGKAMGEIITEALLARYSNGEGSFYAPVAPPVTQPQGGR